MSLLRVQYPWAWFFVSDRWNPQTTDPDDDDGNDRGYRGSDVDWRAVVSAVGKAVIEARCVPDDGRLATMVDVEVAEALRDIDLNLATAWLGGGTTRGVTVRGDMSEGAFQVCDGRHRLWAARHTYASSWARRGRLRRVARWVPGLATPPLPMRPELLEWVVDAIEYPDVHEGHLDSLGASLTKYWTWWRDDAPRDLRRLNGHHIEVLAALCEHWPNLALVGLDRDDA